MSIVIGNKTVAGIHIANKEVQRITISGKTAYEKGPDYFYINNEYNGLNTITLKKNGSPTTGTTLEWSGDLVTWTTVTYNADNEFLISISYQNQRIYFRSTDGFSSSNTDYYNFKISENCKVGGDIRTLLDYTDSTIYTAPAYAFRSLFTSSYHLSDAGDLDLSKLTTLSEGTFSGAFSGCNDLETAPILYATTLATDCYRLMFYDNFILDKLITYFPTWQASYTDSWLNNVAATGDFYNLGGATFQSGASGIPSNWTVHNTL